MPTIVSTFWLYGGLSLVMYVSFMISACVSWLRSHFFVGQVVLVATFVECVFGTYFLPCQNIPCQMIFLRY